MATHGAFTRIHLASSGPDRFPGRPVRPSFAQRALARLAEMRRTHRTRRLLAEMDDRLLSDIGIGRADALMEASRAPWDIRRDIGRR